MSQFKVYKYPLALVAHQTLMLPFGARVLSIQMQGPSQLCAWVQFPTSSEGQSRSVVIHMATTGAPFELPAVARYICTTQVDWFVGHFYAEGA